MKNKSLLITGTLFALLSIGTKPVLASSLKISSDLGYDSNPFRLSDEFDPDAEVFTRVAIRGSLDLNESLRLFGRNQSLFYFGGGDEADSSKTTIGGSYTEKFKLGEKKSRFRARLQWIERDKTYISRLSGEQGTTSVPDPDDPFEEITIEVGDRYDYNESRIDLRLSSRLDKRHRIAGFVEFRERDYESFPQTDLSDLDYSSMIYGGEWQYRLNSGNRIEVGLDLRMRDYDDRRNRNPEGNTIAGTNLDQDSWIARFEYRSKYSESLTLRYQAFYELRDDNGGSYYNAERYRLRLKSTYLRDNNHRLNMSLTYSDTAYPDRADTGVSGVTEDDEVNEQSGYQLSAEYLVPHTSIPELNYVWSVRSDQFDSDLPEYNYDRTQLRFGIEYRIK
ncbi:MAG: hypothetical protein AAF353_06725 [Pseudomonadota bacterium]